MPCLTLDLRHNWRREKMSDIHWVKDASLLTSGRLRPVRGQETAEVGSALLSHD